MVGDALSGTIPGSDRPRELGLDVVTPRTATAESPEEIETKANLALGHYRSEQIFLNTDCGFGCFANRCMTVEKVATGKLREMVQTVRRLREKHA